MRTHLRRPDTLTLSIARGPVRGETTMEVRHDEDGMTVVIFEGWAPVADSQLAPLVERVVRLWTERGPLAATAFMVGARRADGRR